MQTSNESVFIPETVPSIVALSIFGRVSSDNAAYTYREAALIPTNPDDLPIPFETDLINRFRQASDMTELSDLRETPENSLFDLVRLIRIENHACRTDHSTPDQAPASGLLLIVLIADALLVSGTQTEPGAVFTARKDVSGFYVSDPHFRAVDEVVIIVLPPELGHRFAAARTRSET